MLQSQSYINPCSFFLDNPNLYYIVKLTKTNNNNKQQQNQTKNPAANTWPFQKLLEILS